MKNPHIVGEGANHSKQAVMDSVSLQHFPNASLYQRWSATHGDIYCRYCWREYTSPVPCQITEVRV